MICGYNENLLTDRGRDSRKHNPNVVRVKTKRSHKDRVRNKVALDQSSNKKLEERHPAELQNELAQIFILAEFINSLADILGIDDDLLPRAVRCVKT